MKYGCLVIALGCALSVLAGCMEERVVYDHWENFRKQMGGARTEVHGGISSPPPRSVGEEVHADDGWAIVLETFEGDRREERASRLAKRNWSRSSLCR